MGNGRQHLRAVVDEMLQLPLHGIERNDHLADFYGPDRLNRRSAEVCTETPGTFGKMAQRFGQMTRRNQRDQHGRDQHQDDQDQVALPLP